MDVGMLMLLAVSVLMSTTTVAGVPTPLSNVVAANTTYQVDFCFPSDQLSEVLHELIELMEESIAQSLEINAIVRRATIKLEEEIMTSDAVLALPHDCDLALAGGRFEWPGFVAIGLLALGVGGVAAWLAIRGIVAIGVLALGVGGVAAWLVGRVLSDVRSKAARSTAAATAIQRVVRGYLARRSAATLLQAAFRGALARRSLRLEALVLSKKGAASPRAAARSALACLPPIEAYAKASGDLARLVEDTRAEKRRRTARAVAEALGVADSDSTATHAGRSQGAAAVRPVPLPRGPPSPRRCATRSFATCFR